MIDCLFDRFFFIFTKDIKKTDGDAGGFLSDADSGICAGKLRKLK